MNRYRSISESEENLGNPCHAAFDHRSGLLLVLALWWRRNGVEGVFGCYSSLLILLGLIDLKCKVPPNRVVYPGLLLTVIITFCGLVSALRIRFLAVTRGLSCCFYQSSFLGQIDDQFPAGFHCSLYCRGTGSSYSACTRSKGAQRGYSFWSVPFPWCPSDLALPSYPQ